MGKFGNEVEGGGALHHQTKLPWNGEEGFEAMGHEIPAFRRTAAEQHMKDMGFTRPGDAELRFDVISSMCMFLERDNSWQALEVALEKGVDVTGCYRLMAVLLAARKPKEVIVVPGRPKSDLIAGRI